MGVRLSGIRRTVDGDVHLAGVDLDLPDGSFCVLLGATRSGKTSLLRVVAGLDEPDGGQLQRDGRVAMVYQQFVNYPSLTVEQNIASPLRAQGVPRERVREQVHAAARKLGLTDFLKRLPEQLSGGQQQRTALARALVSDAEVVLLDEPLANLDASLRGALREQIRESFISPSSSQGERKHIVLYATHDPSEALWFAGRTLVMHEGRVLQSGSARALYEHPESLEVARLMSAPPLNEWPVQLAASGRLRLSTGVEFSVPEHMASQEPGAYVLAVRPHRLRRTVAGTGSGTSSNTSAHDLALDLQLELAEIDGSITLLHGRHGPLPVLCRAPGVHPLGFGEQYTVDVDLSRCFLFHPSGSLAAAPRRLSGSSSPGRRSKGAAESRLGGN